MGIQQHCLSFIAITASCHSKSTSFTMAFMKVLILAFAFATVAFASKEESVAEEDKEAKGFFGAAYAAPFAPVAAVAPVVPHVAPVNVVPHVAPVAAVHPYGYAGYAHPFY